MVLTRTKGMKAGKLLRHVQLMSSLSAAPRVGLRFPAGREAWLCCRNPNLQWWEGRGKVGLFADAGVTLAYHSVEGVLPGGAALIFSLGIKGRSLPCYITFLYMYMQHKPYSKSFIYTCSFLVSRAHLHHIRALSTWDTDTWHGSSLRLFKKSLVLERLCLFTSIVVVLH